jgi:hypothetical protein
MIVVRYADDLAVGFEHEGDARRFLDAMRERLDVGHVFQQEVGHRFRFEAGRGSDLMSALASASGRRVGVEATVVGAPAVYAIDAS